MQTTSEQELITLAPITRTDTQPSLDHKSTRGAIPEGLALYKKACAKESELAPQKKLELYHSALAAGLPFQFHADAHYHSAVLEYGLGDFQAALGNIAKAQSLPGLSENLKPHGYFIEAELQAKLGKGELAAVCYKKP